MTTNENNLVQATKDTLIIDTENPRFKGMQVNPMDPVPYGDAINRMYDSMIATHKSMGSLLLQPVVATINDNGMLSVSAGYTRSITFLTRYNDLCRELEVEELTIPVIVVDNITLADAAMENMVRTEQHYMSIAHTIKELRSQKMTVKAIAKQLGIKKSEVSNYSKLADLDPSIQQLCYNTIEMPAALHLCTVDPKIQAVFSQAYNKLVKDEVVDSDAKLSSDRDVEYIITWGITDRIPNYVPRFSFTVGELVYPEIHLEEWYVGDLLEGRTLDKDATNERNQAYWDMVRENVDTVEFEDKYHYGAWIEVAMGTHPEEVAVERNTYVAFYMKRNKMEEIDNADRKAREKIESNKNRAESKQYRIVQKAKMEHMRDVMSHIFSSETVNCQELYRQAAIIVAKSLYSKAFNALCEELGVVGIEQYQASKLLDHCGPLDLIERCVTNDLLTSEHVTNAHKQFLADNSYDWDKEVEALEETIADELKLVEIKAEERESGIEDAIETARKMLQDMLITYDINGRGSMYSYIMEEKAETKLLKYVAKALQIKAKGEGQLLLTRMRSAINLAYKSHNIEIVHAAADTADSVQRSIDNARGLLQAQYDAHKVLTKESIEDVINSFSREWQEDCVNFCIDARTKHKVIKNVLKTFSDDGVFYAGEKLAIHLAEELYRNQEQHKAAFAKHRYFVIGKKVRILG